MGNSSDPSMFPSPVPGSLNDNIPTSGGVHLYADPLSHAKRHPILYADCEGLEGGEVIPYCDRVRNDTPYHMTSADLGSHMSTLSNLRRIYYKKRSIRWAEGPQKSKREFVVTQLYPRILYTFSDVIVFVLRNARYSTSIGLYYDPFIPFSNILNLEHLSRLFLTNCYPGHKDPSMRQSTSLCSRT